MPVRRSTLRHATRFKRRLLQWFRSHGRQLPWRATRDPYAILVSEVMLQQTQVSRVRDYYRRFLQRFPTLQALANAHPNAVRRAWNGLGYYGRAANLHRLARTIVRDRGAVLPDHPDALAKLPGVGRYTAGAVASFAYGRRVAAVDTNVHRVLQRAFLPRLRPSAALSQRIWQLAEAILPTRPKVVWEFNQALMDLGSTYCTARAPRCTQCPVRPACRTGERVR